MVEAGVGDVQDAVAFVRMEGKINLIDERLKYITESWASTNTRLNAHSERLNSIEAKMNTEAGKRQGVEQVVKVLWAILAVLLTGGLATIAAVVAALMGAFNGVGG